MRRAPAFAAGAIVAALVMIGGTAVAQPPRAGLCEDLTGDALTRCLYSELDDRLRANDMPPITPSPSATPSTSSTPTSTPSSTPTAAEFKVTTSDVTTNSVKVNWTEVEGATGYRVGRNGRDTGCTAECPWSTTDPATARSRVFNHLLPDTEYTFFVQPVGGERVEIKATTKPAATPTPDPTTPTATPTQPTTSGAQFGYMVFLNPAEEAKSKRDIDEVVAAGGTVVRMGIPEGQAGSISGTNWVPNVSNMDYFTRTVDYADSKGLKVVLVMADFFRSGTTVEDADDLPNDANDQKRAQLKQYLTEVDRRMGAKTDLYQVFNEHDVRDYRTYSPTELTTAYLAAFRETLQVANDALSKPVTTTPFGYPVNQARYDRWVKFFDGVGPALDVIGVHAYPERNDATMNLMVTYIDQLGTKYNKPVALLEFGLPDVAGYGSSAEVGAAIVKQIQAADKSTKLQYATLYQLRDRGVNNAGRTVSGEDVFGILRNDFTQKSYYGIVKDATVAANSGGGTATPSATPSTGATPSTSATPSSTPTATPTQQPAGSWLSGSAGQSASDGAFGTWRGSPVEIVGTWINDPAIYPFEPGGEHASWTGAADVGVVPPTWTSWAHEASGGHDQFWRDTARNLKKYRGGKGTTYVRPWYEYNGDWMDYSVPNNPTDRARFVTAFERVEAIFDAEFPEAKMMLGTAASGGTSTRVTVSEAWPKDVDVLSIDHYNQYPWCTTQACFDDAIENAGGPNSLADLQRLAKAKGVPVMISEWSNAGKVRPASSGGGGESPQFMTSFHSWLKTHAGTGPGQVVGEVVFNITGYDARFELYPDTVMPQTAAKYRELWKTN